MTPTLRSTFSAPNTPTGKSSGTADSPNGGSPRKVPHCTKCKLPRKGHPRQGCPATSNNSPLNPGRYSPQGPEAIAEALGSMHIVVPQDEEKKATIRSRRVSAQATVKFAPDPSLASLSTESSELVARLLRPGIFDDDSDEEYDEGRRDKVAKWQDTLVATPTQVKARVRTKMPGTLNTPSPDTSLGSIRKEEMPEGGSVTSTSSLRPHPLVRSMSIEQREEFMELLCDKSKSSPATVYVLPKADIPAIQESATTLGFHSHVIEDIGGNSDSNSWLILGRDKKAVQALLEGFQVKLATAQNRRGGGLGAAAGGVVVGAMATWTGLAFS